MDEIDRGIVSDAIRLGYESDGVDKPGWQHGARDFSDLAEVDEIIQSGSWLHLHGKCARITGRPQPAEVEDLSRTGHPDRHEDNRGLGEGLDDVEVLFLDRRGQRAGGSARGRRADAILGSDSVRCQWVGLETRRQGCGERLLDAINIHR